MISKSPFQQSLRRIKPEKHSRRLEYRARYHLPFVSVSRLPLPKLLLDTTVYIDVFQGRLPEIVTSVLRADKPWHCVVTESELAILTGMLHPADPDGPETVARISASIALRPEHRTLTPDRDIWREAGILTGLLARLQGYGKPEQRRALNDALIFLTATKYGCAVLTRNISDFDLLMQLNPHGAALFYDRL